MAKSDFIPNPLCKVYNGKRFRLQENSVGYFWYVCEVHFYDVMETDWVISCTQTQNINNAKLFCQAQAEKIAKLLEEQEDEMGYTHGWDVVEVKEEEQDETIETIKHAAWKRNDGIISTGKCHGDIIKTSPYGTCKAGSESGFITSKGRFVDQEEALKIAIESKQISENLDTIRGCGLLSENLWTDSGFKYDPEKGYYKDED